MSKIGQSTQMIGGKEISDLMRDNFKKAKIAAWNHKNELKKINYDYLKIILKHC